MSHDLVRPVPARGALRIGRIDQRERACDLPVTAGRWMPQAALRHSGLQLVERHAQRRCEGSESLGHSRPLARLDLAEIGLADAGLLGQGVLGESAVFALGLDRMGAVQDGMRDRARNPRPIVGSLHGVEQGNVVQALNGTHGLREQIQAGLCDFSQSCNAASIRVCQPGPESLNRPTTSGDSRIVTRCLVGARCGPRSLRCNESGRPENGTARLKSPIVHSGLSSSINSGLGRLFIALYLTSVCLAKTDDSHANWCLRKHQCM